MNGGRKCITCLFSTCLGKVRLEPVSTNRLFEHTDKVLEEQFKKGNSVLFDKLIRYPCLFMQGRHGKWACVRRRIHTDTALRFRDFDRVFFRPQYPPVPNKVIFANKEDFGISQTFEFSRTHWALKDIDLFRTLLRLSQPASGKPKGVLYFQERGN